MAHKRWHFFLPWTVIVLIGGSLSWNTLRANELFETSVGIIFVTWLIGALLYEIQYG
ncbi:MAG: hypothetical protein WCV85_06685 [Patescibacteria group bacterium]|jgi:hypothetical protein